MLLEVGAGTGEALFTYAASHEAYGETDLIKDYQGFLRVLKTKRVG